MLTNPLIHNAMVDFEVIPILGSIYY